MGYVNLADWVDCTEVEGPGKRSALWVQGCTIRCSGCCNAHMLDLVPKRIVDTREVLGWIEEAHKRHHTEGVTFLGGEPMLQARGLADVAAGCRELDLSVVVFTGFTLEHLRNRPMPGVMDLIEMTDLLIDGPYIAEQPETKRNWVGSTNQRFHFLTDRYRPGIEVDPRYPHGFELRVLGDGRLRSSGWPSGIGNQISDDTSLVQ